MGSVIDQQLPTHSITAHYKVPGALVVIALVLFLARMMKGLFVREPIRSETL